MLIKIKKEFVMNKKIQNKRIVYIGATVLALAVLFTGYKTQYLPRHQTALVQQQKEVTYEGKEGQNAFDLLRTKYKVESNSSSLGVMVTAIEGVRQTDKEFWLYEVNGKQPDVGADKYMTKNGDQIRWQLKGF